MPLSPSGYIGTGSSTAAANGNYTPVVGANATLNGTTQYQSSAGDYLCWYGGGWGIFNSVNAGGVPVYLNTTGSSSSNVPLTGWGSGIGTAPTLGFINPQVQINGGFVTCPGTGTTGVPSGSWQILNSAGSVVDSGIAYNQIGTSSMFMVTGPATAGGPVTIKALSTATPGANYQFRTGYVAPQSSGPFDVVAANSQVVKNGAAVSCPASAITGTSSGAWQVLNAGGTIVDSGATIGIAGANGWFIVGQPSAAGSPVNVQAIGNAVAAIGYQYRSTSGSNSSSGPFDVVVNPKVPVNNLNYVSCPGTGTNVPASGVWQVLNSAGTVVDTGSTASGNGANSLFNVGAPTAAGSSVLVKALTGAAIALGYTFRSTNTTYTSSGGFDVVAGPTGTPNLTPGGASLTMFHDGTASPNTLSPNTYAVVGVNASGPPPTIVSGTNPAAGASVTNGHYIITNTGMYDNVGSNPAYPILALAVDSTTTGVTGYGLAVGPVSGTNGYSNATFNVVAPVVAGPTNMTVSIVY